MSHLSEEEEEGISELWDRLWMIRCHLDDQMHSKEATMADIKHTIARASRVCMTLKSHLDAREEPNEEILEEVRNACDFEEAA